MALTVKNLTFNPSITYIQKSMYDTFTVINMQIQCIFTYQTYLVYIHSYIEAIDQKPPEILQSLN